MASRKRINPVNKAGVKRYIDANMHPRNCMQHTTLSGTRPYTTQDEKASIMAVATQQWDGRFGLIPRSGVKSSCITLDRAIKMGNELTQANVWLMPCLIN